MEQHIRIEGPICTGFDDPVQMIHRCYDRVFILFLWHQTCSRAEREKLIRGSGIIVGEDRGRHDGRLHWPHSGDGQRQILRFGEKLLVMCLCGAFLQTECLNQRLRFRIECCENVNHVVFLL